MLAYPYKWNTHGNDDERIILRHVKARCQHCVNSIVQLLFYTRLLQCACVNVQGGVAMIRLRRCINLLIISSIVIILLLYITVSHKTTLDNGTLTEPEEPHKYIPELLQDKTMRLGTLITHVLHPERREYVIVPELDQSIMVSVKTTAQFHRHRLSLLLFTWMQTVSPQQVHELADI